MGCGCGPTCEDGTQTLMPAGLCAGGEPKHAVRPPWVENRSIRASAVAARDAALRLPYVAGGDTRNREARTPPGQGGGVFPHVPRGAEVAPAQVLGPELTESESVRPEDSDQGISTDAIARAQTASLARAGAGVKREQAPDTVLGLGLKERGGGGGEPDGVAGEGEAGPPGDPGSPPVEPPAGAQDGPEGPKKKDPQPEDGSPKQPEQTAPGPVITCGCTCTCVTPPAGSGTPVGRHLVAPTDVLPGIQEDFTPWSPQVEVSLAARLGPVQTLHEVTVRQMPRVRSPVLVPSAKGLVPPTEIGAIADLPEQVGHGSGDALPRFVHLLYENPDAPGGDGDPFAPPGGGFDLGGELNLPGQSVTEDLRT